MLWIDPKFRPSQDDRLLFGLLSPNIPKEKATAWLREFVCSTSDDCDRLIAKAVYRLRLNNKPVTEKNIFKMLEKYFQKEEYKILSLRISKLFLYYKEIEERENDELMIHVYYPPDEAIILEKLNDLKKIKEEQKKQEGSQ